MQNHANVYGPDRLRFSVCLCMCTCRSHAQYRWQTFTCIRYTFVKHSNTHSCTSIFAHHPTIRPWLIYYLCLHNRMYLAWRPCLGNHSCVPCNFPSGSNYILKFSSRISVDIYVTNCKYTHFVERVFELERGGGYRNFLPYKPAFQRMCLNEWLRSCDWPSRVARMQCPLLAQKMVPLVSPAQINLLPQVEGLGTASWDHGVFWGDKFLVFTTH